MNRIFFLLLMTVVALSCGQFESQAIGQIDSVFSTPPYVRAGDFSAHKAQPYQMSSSFESKFVPLSSKEVGNLSQLAIPPSSANAAVPPLNLNFPSDAAAVKPNPTPISLAALPHQLQGSIPIRFRSFLHKSSLASRK